jgi:hypothetical protein
MTNLAIKTHKTWVLSSLAKDFIGLFYDKARVGVLYGDAN